MERAGMINIYSCDLHHHTVTRNAVDGTTPFMILCPECKHPARSRFYRVDQTLIPTWEFYRPADEEIEKMDDAHRKYLSGGALLPRKI